MPESLKGSLESLLNSRIPTFHLISAHSLSLLPNDQIVAVTLLSANFTACYSVCVCAIDSNTLGIEAIMKSSSKRDSWRKKSANCSRLNEQVHFSYGAKKEQKGSELFFFPKNRLNLNLPCFAVAGHHRRAHLDQLHWHLPVLHSWSARQKRLSLGQKLIGSRDKCRVSKQSFGRFRANRTRCQIGCALTNNGTVGGGGLYNWETWKEIGVCVCWLLLSKREIEENDQVTSL